MNSSSMTPIDWAKRPIVEKYADFAGRAPRAEYWWFYLLVVVGYIITTIIDSILGMGPYGVLTILFALAMLLPSLAVGVRRLHDTNRSGWWLLIGLVPLIGAIVLLVFFVLPSEPAENSYGSSPYGEAVVPAE
jgi:uncharacterized membrane protein YhaH (DUF805 family)